MHRLIFGVAATTLVVANAVLVPIAVPAARDGPGSMGV